MISSLQSASGFCGVLDERVSGVLEVFRHRQVAEQRHPRLGDQMPLLLPRRALLLPQLHLAHLQFNHEFLQLNYNTFFDHS
jgi:hypothetical protein